MALSSSRLAKLMLKEIGGVNNADRRNAFNRLAKAIVQEIRQGLQVRSYGVTSGGHTVTTNSNLVR